MRIFVVCDNDSEREDADNLATVLEALAPSWVADAIVTKDGSVTIRHGSGVRRKIPATVANWLGIMDEATRKLLQVG